MNKIMLIFVAFGLLTISNANPNDEKTITIDTQNSNLEWVGRKVTGTHNGTIQILKGTVSLKNDILMGGTFILDMTSIVDLDLESEEWNQKLIGHLKSDDFFSVESHPTATLEITKAQFRRSKKATEANYEISGVLTIKGIAKDVSFPARIVRNEHGYEATGKIDLDRTRWDIRYGSGKFFDNLGDKMIHDLFTIKFAFKTANYVEGSYSR
ncbi:MAG: YceI family protein [Candidatus Marinimicrobia bacterium]|nr:YceI family protein [Candidatus Neomarinimicrobiota bacterium]